MRKRLRPIWRNEKGAATALVAVSLSALVAMMALGIDIGMLFNAKSEAQRTADSAALAGASAFLDFPAKEAPKPARERAVEYAIQNDIRKVAVDPSEVAVQVNVDSATVTVTVRRSGVSTWFARLLSVEEVAISATATAQASNAGAAQCLKPFAVPDAWEETTEDGNGNRIQDPWEVWRFDPSADRYAVYTGPGGSSTETGYGGEWRDGIPDFEGRVYDQDYGRQITLKVTDPHGTLVPSFFYPWVLPVDSGQPDCGEDRDLTDPGKGNNGKGKGKGGNNGNGNNGNNGNGNNGDNGSGNNGNNGNGNNGNNGNGNNGNNGNGNNGNNGNANNGNNGNNGQGQDKDVEDVRGHGNGNGGNNGNGNNGNNGKGKGKKGDTGPAGKGGAAYRRNICSCNASVIDLESEYLIEPGNMVGPTYQGVQELILQDEHAKWDPMNNRVIDSDYPEGDSPRIITVALFDPAEIQKGGRQTIQFNNFARFFIEGQASPQDPVVGRFLYYVAGMGSGSLRGTRTGSLIKRLRLIR